VPKVAVLNRDDSSFSALAEPRSCTRPAAVLTYGLDPAEVMGSPSNRARDMRFTCSSSYSASSWPRR
jgi:hypothetical protein